MSKPTGNIHFVGRRFNVDYIYFDLLFLFIWVSALIVLAMRKTKLPLIFGAVGLIVYYLIDWGIWHCLTGIRKVSGPIHPALLMLWVSATPGIVHPSWVMLMIEGVYRHTLRRRDLFFWTSLFFSVQFIPAMLQTNFHVDDRLITISRDMGRASHGVMIFLFCLGYGILMFCQISVTDMLKLFTIGITVEGFFEYSLWFSGIRSTAFRAVVFDTVFEFNCGIGLLFFAWSLMIPKEQRVISLPQLNLPPVVSAILIQRGWIRRPSSASASLSSTTIDVNGSSASIDKELSRSTENHHHHISMADIAMDLSSVVVNVVVPSDEMDDSSSGVTMNRSPDSSLYYSTKNTIDVTIQS